MRILIVNPNTSQSVTDVIAAEAARAASPGTEMRAVTAPFGPPFVETRGEAMVAAQAVLSAVAENAAGCDAVIVAAFGDPGLGGARELLSIPVVGIAEAAMLTACMLGDRISIVSVSRRHVPVLRECILRYGLGERLASIRTTAEPVDPSYVGDAQNTYRDQLVRFCHDTVEQDGAEVVIFGGGPLAGLARTVADRIPVPVLDGTACAVRQAETLVALRPSKPSKGSYSRPAPKTVTGVAPDLARLFGAG